MEKRASLEGTFRVVVVRRSQWDTNQAVPRRRETSELGRIIFTSLDTRSGRPSSPPSRKRWNSGGCSMRAVKDGPATSMGERCDGAEKETEGPRLGYI